MRRRQKKKKKKGNAKGLAQREHAKKRAAERFGLDMNDAALKAIVRRIQQGDFVTFVQRQSLRTSVWKLDVREHKDVHVVYDRNRKEVVTFLPGPPRSLDSNEETEELSGTVEKQEKNQENLPDPLHNSPEP